MSINTDSDMNRMIKETTLTHTMEVTVRFSELDALRMVWHGNYLKYLEDAREAWGIRYGLGYMDMYNNGFVAPLYDMQLHYRGIATINDRLKVTVTYCNTTEGRIVFRYEICNAQTGAQILTAESLQLFLTTDGVFYPTAPDFYQQWKKEHGVC